MIYERTLSVLYPLKPAELSLEIHHTSGTVTVIRAIVDGIPVEFVKEPAGSFSAPAAEGIELPYLKYLIRQLNREFGG